MQWTKCQPIDPGIYWVIEFGEQPHLVHVDIESDSHGMFFVLLPDDDYKYPLELWEGALWSGPFSSYHEAR